MLPSPLRNTQVLVLKAQTKTSQPTIHTLRKKSTVYLLHVNRCLPRSVIPLGDNAAMENKKSQLGDNNVVIKPEMFPLSSFQIVPESVQQVAEARGSGLLCVSVCRRREGRTDSRKIENKSDQRRLRGQEMYEDSVHGHCLHV